MLKDIPRMRLLRSLKGVTGPKFPFIDDLPDTVDQSVYRSAVILALKYAKAGVEGKIHGHILVLGNPVSLLALGTRNRFDPFEMAFLSGTGDIRDDKDNEEV